MDIIEKILYLKNVILFRELGGEELIEIARITEEKMVINGEVIFEEGSIGNELFIIVKGKVSIYQGDVELAVLSDYDYFSEMSLFDSMPRSASAKAIENSIFLVISRDKFLPLLKLIPEISIAIIRVFSQRIRDMNIKFFLSKVNT